jgi:glycosyltransferase involved in cell wall biosynthesis
VKPRVTVVIPTIDRESLVYSLNSVATQTFQGFEVIIVDDSKEQSVSVPGFRVVKTGGLAGVSKARNLGMSYVSTEFIALLDDDDLWHGDYLATQIVNFERFGIDFGLTGAIVNGHHRPKNPLKVGVDPFELLYGKPHLLRSKAYLPTSAYFFRTKIAENVRFDNSITDRENLKFVKECFNKNYKVYQDPQPLVSINYSSSESLSRINIKEEIEWSHFLGNLNQNWADNFLIESSRNFLRSGDRKSARILVKLLDSKNNLAHKAVLRIATI